MVFLYPEQLLRVLNIPNLPRKQLQHQEHQLPTSKISTLQDLFIEINIINDLSDVMTSCSTTTKLTIILTRNDSELRKQAIKEDKYKSVHIMIWEFFT